MEILYKNNILETEDLKVLGANNEGVVYQYKNNAIKIYHKHPKKFILTKDVCEQFTKKTISIGKILWFLVILVYSEFFVIQFT